MIVIPMEVMAVKAPTDLAATLQHCRLPDVAGNHMLVLLLTPALTLKSLVALVGGFSKDSIETRPCQVLLRDRRELPTLLSLQQPSLRARTVLSFWELGLPLGMTAKNNTSHY